MTHESAKLVVQKLTVLAATNAFCHVQIGDAEIIAAKTLFDGSITYRIRGISFSAEQLLLGLMMSHNIPAPDDFFYFKPGDMNEDN